MKMKTTKGPPPTHNGFDFHEVLSALQKAIRRNDPGKATVWAMELAMSGMYHVVSARLRIIAQEDIGPADPLAVIFANVALDNADTWKKKDNSAWRMAIANACFVLARAKKSHVGDFLQAAALKLVLDGPKPEIPDEALDKHTFRGRNMGRGLDHFLEHGAKLVGEQPFTEYEEKLRPHAVQFWSSKGNDRVGKLEEGLKKKSKKSGAAASSD